MPSQILTSGFTTIASGQIFSGCSFPVDGILVYLDKFGVSGPPVVVGCSVSGLLSGYAVAFNSGGSLPLVSGGLLDGFPLYPGDSIFVPKGKLLNGGSAPALSGVTFGLQIFVPASNSGTRLYWDTELRRF